MIDVLGILAILLGLGALMVVHEGGHLLVARAFGMRVVKFSIGFGPTIWRHQPKNSPTTYQIAIIPFLAYVQIAGMNPFEENDPDDKGSYANASLIGRLATIVAGPAANYGLASIIFFVIFLFAGQATNERSLHITPTDDMPAVAAGFESGDRIVAINGAQMSTPAQVKETVEASPDSSLMITVDRDGETLDLTVTPTKLSGHPMIGVSFKPVRVPVTLSEAGLLALTYPAERAYQQVAGLPDAAKSLQHSIDKPDDVQFMGVWGMFKLGGRLLREGPVEFFTFLGLISMALAVFNMLPIPALDGGRLMFLGYEAVTRRKPNAKIEAHIHAVGFLMLIGLMVLIVSVDARRSTDKERLEQDLSERNGAEQNDRAPTPKALPASDPAAPPNTAGAAAPP